MQRVKRLPIVTEFVSGAEGFKPGSGARHYQPDPAGLCVRWFAALGAAHRIRSLCGWLAMGLPKLPRPEPEQTHLRLTSAH